MTVEKVGKEHFVKVFPVHYLSWQKNSALCLHDGAIFVRKNTDHMFFMYSHEYARICDC